MNTNIPQESERFCNICDYLEDCLKCEACEEDVCQNHLLETRNGLVCLDCCEECPDCEQ